MSRPTAAYTGERIAVGVRATYGAFIGAGFTFASWASRIPQVRDRLHLSPGQLGLLLLSLAAGSVIALPSSGAIVHRLTTRVTVTATSVVAAGALAFIGLGYLLGVIPVAIGLFVFGFAYGAWDVAMNVQGADVERHLGRAIMPRFHAGFSIGTVAGALLGAAMIALHVPVTAHLVVVAVCTAVVVPRQVRGYLPDSTPPGAEPSPGMDAGSPSPLLARWLEPRTLVVGLVVLAFAFAEGTGNDWISVALIDGRHAPAVVGTLGYAAFLTAMTSGRWVGPGLLDRFGRVATVRTLAVVAVAGLLVFVFSPYTPLAIGGALLWGVGTSLGFPVGMSAASDDASAAAGRVSVVASIGYCAFLGGPPLIGYVGSRVGVLHALSAAAVLLAVALLLAGWLRPLQPGDSSGVAEHPEMTAATLGS
ncbi:MFS transporter [Acidothermaceae bacterium B102]|nr:MFS transporter [Acidothermaceae bacterium B102]